MKKLLLLSLAAMLICPFGLCLIAQEKKIEIEDTVIVESCRFTTAGPAFCFKLQQCLPDVDIFNDEEFDCPASPVLPPNKPNK